MFRLLALHYPDSWALHNLPIAMWSSPSWQPQPTSTLGDQTPQQRLHCSNIPNTIFLFDGFKNRLGFPINIYLFQQHRKQNVRKHSQGTRGHFHFDRFFFWMILMKMVAHSWFMLFTIKKAGEEIEPQNHRPGKNPGDYRLVLVAKKTDPDKCGNFHQSWWN